MEREYDLEWICPFPTIGKGKKANQLCTVNNLPYFYRYGITRIKNTFKEQLKEWYIPKHTGEPTRSALVIFRIKRKNKKRIDPDSAALPQKWIADVLVEQGYLIDDDQIRYILEPTEYSCEGVDTSIYCRVKLTKGVDHDY